MAATRPEEHGGGDGNRTRVQGFAGPCLSHSATPPQKALPQRAPPQRTLPQRTLPRKALPQRAYRKGFPTLPRADDGIRTRDPHLGKVMLYQLSHVRSAPWGAFRTVAYPAARANSEPGGRVTSGGRRT